MRSTKTDQTERPRSLISLSCPREESLHPWLSKMCPVKIMDNCTITQADLNLRRAHMCKDTFSEIAAYLVNSLLI